MPTLSITDKNKYLLCIPFMYAFRSRYEWPKGYLFEAATLIAPSLLFTFVLYHETLFDTVISFSVGYVLFMAVYEIGYMVNDSYGLRHDVTPRRRVPIDFDIPFVLCFLIIRVFLFVGLVFLFDLIYSPHIYLSYGTLTAALIFHNTQQRVEFKFMTFFQLSALRFYLPNIVTISWYGKPEDAVLLICVGILLFVFPRFLTFLDSKNRLHIPERKEAGFILGCHVFSTPLILLLSFSYSSTAPTLVWLLHIFFQTIYIVTIKARTSYTG